jgi:YHS domain-containing protein
MAGNPSERSNSATSGGQANGAMTRELPTPAGGTEELAFNSVETGMDGFCPVYLRQKGSLKLGSDQYETVYQGIRYQFVSEANRLQFLKDPAKYAPQDLGCDPVILTKEHRALAGDVRLRLWFDGRLYLFSSDESQVEFRTRPLRYSQMRSAVKAEDIQRTKLQ